jgi:hypothetical protein
MPDDDRLTRLETLLEQTHAQLVAVRGIVEGLAMRHTELRALLARQDARLTNLESQAFVMQQTLVAIKDLLDRGNGR